MEQRDEMRPEAVSVSQEDIVSTEQLLPQEQVPKDHHEGSPSKPEDIGSLDEKAKEKHQLYQHHEQQRQKGHQTKTKVTVADLDKRIAEKQAKYSQKATGDNESTTKPIGEENPKLFARVEEVKGTDDKATRKVNWSRQSALLGSIIRPSNSNTTSDQIEDNKHLYDAVLNNQLQRTHTNSNKHDVIMTKNLFGRNERMKRIKDQRQATKDDPQDKEGRTDSFLACLCIFSLMMGLICSLSMFLIVWPRIEASNRKARLFDEVASFTPPEILKNKSTPQHQAYQWIQNTDRMEVLDHLAQRYSLVVLYYSTGGGGDDGWNSVNWLNEAVHECEWEFIECNALQVTEIHLSNNSLGYQIPTELGFLSSLGKEE